MTTLVAIVGGSSFLHGNRSCGTVRRSTATARSTATSDRSRIAAVSATMSRKAKCRSNAAVLGRGRRRVIEILYILWAAFSALSHDDWIAVRLQDYMLAVYKATGTATTAAGTTRTAAAATADQQDVHFAARKHERVVVGKRMDDVVTVVCHRAA